MQRIIVNSRSIVPLGVPALVSSMMLLTTLAFTSCKQSAPAPQNAGAQKSPGADAASQAGPPPASPVDPATAGSITGVVHLDGKAPAPLAIDMSADPACAMSATPNLTEQFVTSHGNLANVYIYVKAGAAPSSAPQGAPVVLDQKGCRYVPHVIAVQQGGSVEFRNSDPSTHNVHTMPTQAGNQSIDVSESPMGSPQAEHFKSVETMIPVRCNNHPWMNAFVNVAPNGYFAVSGGDGSFSIHGLPPGNYTLAAVHEKLGEVDIPVTVTAKSTTTARFTFASKK